MILDEANAVNNKKAAKGTIQFLKSDFTDPHIQQAIKIIAQARGVSEGQVQAHIAEGVKELAQYAAQAPLLYETMLENAVESETFKLFWETEAEIQTAPKFSVMMFNKLMRYITVERDEFFPLRSYIDRRRLQTPIINFNEHPHNAKGQITTAAATPSAKFIFNRPFMQKLMDYAHIKGVKGKGKKWESNGGEIPDEYVYIEFLIMHEFMHYSRDDFYYQKIIPGANPKIINWVGDFRTNYFLVKNGFEQLPIGLFCDNINYDRQKEYIDMYRLVESEMKKLKQDQDKGGEKLDDYGDDHEPGQEEGKNSDPSQTEGTTQEGAQDHDKQVEEEAAKKKDASKDDLKKADKNKQGEGKPGEKSNEPGTGKGAGSEVDYSSVMPTFNWKALIARFIKSARNMTQETYSRPSRRSLSGMEIIRQRGAGAVKPAERPLDYVDLSLMFILDCSGSMMSDLPKVYSNVNALLRQPVFARSEVYVMKFSGDVELYKGVFAKNKARKLTLADIAGKKKMGGPQYNLTMTQVFLKGEGGGTMFTAANRAAAESILKKGYNALMITDTDITYGENKDNILMLLKAYPKQVFLIFNNRESYIQWRQVTGWATANITYLT
jgi:hypothetical protein